MSNEQPQSTKPSPRIGTHPCGFHASSDGSKCPGATRNGDGSVIICPRYQGPTRCLDCGSTERVREDTWTCVDVEGCRDAIRARVESNPTIRQLREIQRALAADRPTPTTTKTIGTAPRAARSTRGECLCCGEPTRGGRFLPGHDSRYLTHLVERYNDPTKRTQGEQPEDIRRLAHQVSEAFGGKFDKRVAQ